MKKSLVSFIILNVAVLMRGKFRYKNGGGVNFSEWAGIPATGKTFKVVGFTLMKVLLVLRKIIWANCTRLILHGN